MSRVAHQLLRMLCGAPRIRSGVEVKDAAGLLVVLNSGFFAQSFQRVAAVITQRHQLADAVAQTHLRALAHFRSPGFGVRYRNLFAIGE